MQAVTEAIEASDLSTALKLLRRLQKNYGEILEVCDLWAKYYIEKEQYDRALTWIEKAIIEDPGPASRYLLMARIHLAREDREAVVEVLWRGVDDS
ncbi:hypothetical protein GF377_07160, partial [candidate division GN15 bacterium]|nr:hypothetical protein [candidate division GN15 bacterium]